MNTQQYFFCRSCFVPAKGKGLVWELVSGNANYTTVVQLKQPAACLW